MSCLSVGWLGCLIFKKTNQPVTKKQSAKRPDGEVHCAKSLRRTRVRLIVAAAASVPSFASIETRFRLVKRSIHGEVHCAELRTDTPV